MQTRTVLSLLVLASPAAADPLAVIDRPVIVPAGEAGFATNVDVQKPATGADVTTMAIGGGFGVTDRLELGVNYRFAFDAFELRGPLTVYGGALLAHTDRISVAAGADFVADFAQPAMVAGMPTMTTTETVHMGIGARANLTRTVALYTGNILAPNPAGQQIAIGLDHNAPVTFDLPTGLALQASERVLLRFETVMARLGIAHAKDQVAFVDTTPLTASALVAVTHGLDLAAFFTDPDLGRYGDRFTFGFIARWYAQ